MKVATSLSLNNKNLDFINAISKETKKTKSVFVDNLIDSYRKFWLKKEMQEGFKAQTQEDVDFAELCFDDYLKIIKDSEK